MGSEQLRLRTIFSIMRVMLLGFSPYLDAALCFRFLFLTVIITTAFLPLGLIINIEKLGKFPSNYERISLTNSVFFSQEALPGPPLLAQPGLPHDALREQAHASLALSRFVRLPRAVVRRRILLPQRGRSFSVPNLLLALLPHPLPSPPCHPLLLSHGCPLPHLQPVLQPLPGPPAHLRPHAACPPALQSGAPPTAGESDLRSAAGPPGRRCQPALPPEAPRHRDGEFTLAGALYFVL